MPRSIVQCRVGSTRLVSLLAMQLHHPHIDLQQQQPQLPKPPRSLLSDYGNQISSHLLPCFDAMLANSIAVDEQRDALFK